MAIFLAVCAALFGIACVFIDKMNSDLISNELNKAEALYTEEEVIYKKDALIVITSRDGSYAVKNGDDYFSVKDITDIIQKSETISSGVYDSFYYTTCNVSEGTLLIALDMSKHSETIHSMKIRVLLSLIIFYVIIVLTVIACSSKVFLPMQQTLFRQRQFVSDAGHELKTPVTIISANTDVLKKISDNKYLDSIQSQTKRLEFLINDMLTLTKLDEDKFSTEKETFSLSNAVNESALPFEEVAFEKGKILSFDVQEGIEYFGDRKALIKILEILLDNAIKYSSEKGMIKISLKKEGNTNIITVYNTGSEIPPEDADKLFDRFFRGEDSRSRNSGGSGLGLAIAKSYCALNRWKISAISEYRKSMTISIKL